MCVPDAQVYEMLQYCYKTVCEFTGGRFFSPKELQENSSNLNAVFVQVTQWLCRPQKKSLIIGGSVGLGKTTMVNAIILLVDKARTHEARVNNRQATYPLSIGYVTAGDFARITLAKDANATTDKGLTVDDCYRRDILIIDDLGTEPLETVNFGNRSLPLVDLLFARFERRKSTIITTNLDFIKLKADYGIRIYDRMRKDCQVTGIVGESSWRKILSK